MVYPVEKKDKLAKVEVLVCHSMMARVIAEKNGNWKGAQSHQNSWGARTLTFRT
jgi:hypothetical protein